MMYQDIVSKKVYISSFQKSGLNYTIEYESIDGFVLAAATNGLKGEFYYLLVEEGASTDRKDEQRATLFRARLDLNLKN